MTLDRGGDDRATAHFAIGLSLPLFAGGNVLFFLYPLPGILVFSLLAIGFVIVTIAAGRKRWALDTIDLCLLAFVFCWLANYLARPIGPRVGLETIGLLTAVLLHMAAARRPLGDADFMRLVAGLTLAGLVTAAYGQYQWWVAFPRIEPLLRDVGTGLIPSVNANFYNANAYGVFLSALLLLVVGVLRGENRPLIRAYFSFAALVVAGTLALSGSRSSVALLLVILAVWLGARGIRLSAARLAGAAGAVATLAWMAARWIDPIELWRVGTLGRIAIWRGAFDMIGDHWLLGVGLGGFADAFYRYRITDYYTRYPHSFPLEVWAEIGILGLLPLVAFLGLSIALAVRRGAPETTREGAALAAIALLLVHGAVDIDWHAPANVILLFLLLGTLRAGSRTAAT